MSADENKAIVRRVNDEVWNMGNLEAIDELIADDFVTTVIGAPEQILRRSRTGRELDPRPVADPAPDREPRHRGGRRLSPMQVRPIGMHERRRRSQRHRGC